MAHTRTWNAAYEANPADTQDANLGATRIRELKQDIRERLDLDHIMDDDDDDDGRHRVVSLIEQASDPSNLTNQHKVYSKDVGGVTEIFFRDDSGDIQQITNNGKLLILATNNAWTKGQAVTELPITYAATITPDASLSNAFRCTLTGNVILDNPTNGQSGQVVSIRFIQDGTGSRLLTFGSTLYGNTNDDLALSTGANDQDILTLYFRDTRWHVMSLKKDMNNAL